MWPMGPRFVVGSVSDFELNDRVVGICGLGKANTDRGVVTRLLESVVDVDIGGKRWTFHPYALSLQSHDWAPASTIHHGALVRRGSDLGTVARVGRNGIHVDFGHGPEPVEMPSPIVEVVDASPSAKPDPNAAKPSKGKRKWSLVPLRVFGCIIDAMQWAIERTSPPPYERDSWKNVKDWRELYGEAALRHLDAFQRGDLFDAQSKLSNLWHAGACLAIMIARELAEKDAESS